MRHGYTELADGKVVIVAGFQGVDEQAKTTTRSDEVVPDTSAVALAAAKAAECQIYTDVDGVYAASWTYSALIALTRKCLRWQAWVRR